MTLTAMNNMTNPNLKSAMSALIAFNIVEKKLNEIFAEDKKLDNPVFLFINDDLKAKIAHFITGNINRPVAIGIAGETASGKSTFTMDLLEVLSEYEKRNHSGSLFTRINTDDYYYDRSKEVKAAGSFAEFAKNYDLDVPAAFELDLLKHHIEQLVMGKTVMLPKYDMSGTAIRIDNHVKAEPNKIIISEGLYNLSDSTKDVFDLCIYVDVDRNIQKDRFYRRAAQRGLGDSAEQVYNNAVSKAEVHVMPSKNNADIVINGMADREDYKSVMKKLLNIFTSDRNEKVLVS